MTSTKTYRGLNTSGVIVEDSEYAWNDLTPGTEGFVEIEDLGGGGWDWEQFTCWYDTRSGRYYWSHQAGCSCNSFEVDGLGDLCDGDRASAIRAVKDISPSSYSINERDISEAAARIRNFDPRKVAINEGA